MLIRQIKLNNLLSFGPDTEALPLKDLNVIIGPNGSGKSNLIEAIGLLQSSPTTQSLSNHIRGGGGIIEWLWKGDKSPTATIEAIIDNPRGIPFRYRVSFTKSGQRFELTDERIESEKPFGEHDTSYLYFGYQNNRPFINVKKEDERRELRREDIDPEKSILSQIKDPHQYPELTFLGKQFEKIKIYSEWFFGRHAPLRSPQKADLPNDFLQEDCNNLGLILNRIRQDAKAKKSFLNALHDLYQGIEDFDVRIESGSIQVFLQEGNMMIPASRLSDGTLRYLCLLAILCHPNPPPLVCIEEPELGLHPDIISSLTKLLIEASEKTQLIVTTHSDILIDGLTPDAVIVCEKPEQSTILRRLDAESLKVWLKDYTLGELWSKGEIGGNRW